MAVLYWIVRIYKYVIVAWVVMTWLPLAALSGIHDLLWVVVGPVISPFSFLRIGPFGFGPIIPLFILNFVETWLGRMSGQIRDTPQRVNPPGVVDVTDLQPAIAQPALAPPPPDSGGPTS